MRNKLVITIDGPSGVGKSTVSKVLADRLAYLYLDTGALYRAVAYQLTAGGLSPEDGDALEAFLETLDIDLEYAGDGLHIFMNGEEITQKIRTEDIGLMASRVSAIPVVREALLHLQRRKGENGGIVAEGRDMGTVVFPDAEVKFFLEASENERAKRRYDELLVRGEKVDYGKVAEDMEKRDKQDRERSIAPLKAHPDAVWVDTTNLSAAEVVDHMLEIIRSYQVKRFAPIPD